MTKLSWTKSNAEAGPASVVSLWRYPVKSMMGEELDAADVTQRGLVGDRAYALMDPSNGKVVSAKNPRKWPQLFSFRAAFLEPPRTDQGIPPVRITLPNGMVVTSDQGDLDQILLKVLGRKVTLETTAPDTPSLEEYWPDMDGLTRRDTVTEESMPAGTFFDFATVHVLTTATIERLRELYPQGEFEVTRFRPNVVVGTELGRKGFVENDWVGHALTIGKVVRLSIVGPCPRCVMTTLAQGDLPPDPGILRAVAQHNEGNVGVYANVLQGGTIRLGDPIEIE